MREDLIERLQLKRDVWRGTEFGDDICELLDEAADALEALRAEVERVTCELMDAITRSDKLAEEVEALRAEVREAREFRDKMANAIGNDQLRRFIEKHGEPVPLTIRMQEAEARADKLRAEVERLTFEMERLQQQYDERTACMIVHRGSALACSDAVRAAYSDEHHRAERLAEALRLALNSHGKTLLTDPPQDAWKVNRVEEIGRALLRDQENNDA